MKETFIQEVTDLMSGTLTVDQMTQLNSVLLQTLSRYTLIEDGDKIQEDIVSNNRLLEIFLSAKLVEGCSTKTIKYYETTVRQLFRYMPKSVKEYTTDDLRAYLAVFQKKHIGKHPAAEIFGRQDVISVINGFELFIIRKDDAYRHDFVVPVRFRVYDGYEPCFYGSGHCL